MESVIKPCESFSLPNSIERSSKEPEKIHVKDTEANAISSPYDTSARA